MTSRRVFEPGTSRLYIFCHYIAENNINTYNIVVDMKRSSKNIPIIEKKYIAAKNQGDNFYIKIKYFSNLRRLMGSSKFSVNLKINSELTLFEILSPVQFLEVVRTYQVF